jgi:antitoxin component HigA of HigAB toxin-antitoxin module
MSDLNMHRAERLQIILTAEEVAALDDWRFANRMPTRAAAIRELMKRGMAVRIDGDGANRIGRRSRDVRLVDRRPNGGNGTAD